MDVSPAMFAFASTGFAVLLASVWAWLLILARTFSTPRGQSLVAWSSRRPVPWAFIDLLLLIALWILASLVVSHFLQDWTVVKPAVEAAKLATPERHAVLIGNMLVSIAILAIGLPLIGHRTSAVPRDLGLSLGAILADLRLGCLGFILLAPPVYALQGLLVKFWKPSQHPLVEMFKGSPEPLFFIFLFLSAAIVAPLFEEFIFRIVLQGYVEKWFGPHVTLRELFLGNDRQRHVADRATDDEPIADDAVIQATLVEDANPYAPPQAPPVSDDQTVTANSELQPELRGIQTWLPIAVSSAVFSLLHYTHGPDWIPLLFLAAGMGYLYQRTHRLLPSLTVHCLLNSYSLWGLWIQTTSGAK